MTMVRAIVLLILASGLLTGSVLLFIMEHGEGFEFTTRTGGPGAGARTGPNAVVEAGGTLSPGASEATARAVLATVTALAGGGSVAGTPAATVSGPVGIGQPVELQGSRYTVLQVLDPEPAGFFPAEPGKRRVAIEIRQESLGQAVAFSFALFSLRDTAGADHTWAITNGEPSFGSGSLGPGESTTGWVTFSVEENAMPASLVVLAGTRRVALVDLE